MRYNSIAITLLLFAGWAALLGFEAHAEELGCHPQPLPLVQDLFAASQKVGFVAGTPVDSLAEPLRTLFAKEKACVEGGEVCSINWDIWRNGQDGDLKGPPQYGVKSNGDRATVGVKLDVTNGSRSYKNQLSFDLQREGVCWKLREVRHHDYSLLRVLGRP